MKTNLSEQYNNFANIFSKTHDNGNKFTNQIFFNQLRSGGLQDKKILDLGCGDGTDMQYYKYRFSNNVFGVVISKYALQTVDEFNNTYQEVARVLKKSGLFVFLVVHPFRQFFEKKSNQKNYFDKKIVNSVLFNGKVVVEEPTHTVQEYLSPEFFKYFSLESFIEKSDFYSAEKIGPDDYPTYLIISAKKL